LSLKEKTAWVSLLATLLIYGNYFLDVGLKIDPATPTNAFMMKMITVVVGVIIVNIVGNIIANISSYKDSDEKYDERDRLIRARAGDISGNVLGVGVVIASGQLFYNGTAIEIVHWVLLSLVVSEIVNNATKIAHYRFWLQ